MSYRSYSWIRTRSLDRQRLTAERRRIQPADRGRSFAAPTRRGFSGLRDRDHHHDRTTQTSLPRRHGLSSATVPATQCWLFLFREKRAVSSAGAGISIPLFGSGERRTYPGGEIGTQPFKIVLVLETVLVRRGSGSPLQSRQRTVVLHAVGRQRLRVAEPGSTCHYCRDPLEHEDDYLRPIVKNNTHRMAATGANPADTVPQIHSIGAARTFNRPMVYGDRS
jgi:hypothetical protein